MKKAIQFILFSFVTIALLTGCSSHPEIILENIQNDIVGKITGEDNMPWIFAENEPREISIVESKYEGDKATIIIDMTTQSAPGALMREKRAGKLGLHYEWITNEWNLIRVENLTFK
jgi:hypothetical protein